jgi:hypothetical protein
VGPEVEAGGLEAPEVPAVAPVAAPGAAVVLAVAEGQAAVPVGIDEEWSRLNPKINHIFFLKI